MKESTVSVKNTGLVRYLEDEMSISSSSIAMALRQCGQDLGLLPITLWQYGFVTIDQLDKIFDWMENA